MSLPKHEDLDQARVRHEVLRAQAIREGGHVQRLHTVPIVGDASNAKHQWAMAVLYLQLHPAPSMYTLNHILHHDVAERWVGDTPATAKYDANGLTSLGAASHLAEATVEQELGLDLELPSPGEKQWVKALDILECLMFSADQLALGNRNLQLCHDNCKRLLQAPWVPEIVRKFAAQYEWTRTSTYGNEVMHELATGLR